MCLFRLSLFGIEPSGQVVVGKEKESHMRFVSIAFDLK